jgi:PAS domain S-box-containing protein
MPSPADLAALLLVVGGVVLLLLASVQVGAMASLGRGGLNVRTWQLLRGLILMFAAGYGGFLVIVYRGQVDLLAGLVSVILFGGGAFVYLVVRVSRSSLTRLIETSVARDDVRSVIDAMPDALLMVDARGVITSCNRRAHELTGYGPEELVGRRVEDLLAIPADPESMLSGARPREQELGTRSGKKIPVSAVFAGAVAIDSAAPATVCVLTDRREEHRHERQLEQAVQIAESVLRARNQLAATLIDEGLPPLGQLRDAAARLTVSGLSEPQQGSVRAINLGIDALGRVIHGLLERVHGVDAIGRATHTVELAEVMTSVCDALRSAAGPVELRWRLDDSAPPRYLGSDSLVYEVLMLLGRYLLSSGRPKELEFTAARVPGEDDRLIFTAGTDANATDPASSSSMIGRLIGTQLALSTARLLVHTMGGKLWLTDEGTQVSFTVMMEHEVAPTAGADEPGVPGGRTPLMWLAATEGRYHKFIHEAEPTRKGGVLVVDDSPQSREVLAHHLRSWGYEPTVADSGESCLRMLRERRFDVMLLDVLLPDLNGIEVLAALREGKLAEGMAVVMVSALEEKGSITACLEQGAQDYVSKPIHPAMLRARLTNIYERKILGDQAKQQIDRLASEMRRSDTLLRVILPDSVAEELLATNGVTARRHEGVAVLFADIVGFTAYCETQPAEVVVVQLQALITTIEELCERHRVLKIKTAGDALMASAGLLDADPDPVARCVELGLAILDAVHRHPAGWTVRIGVHYGHVVSGIVGRRQFLFDIWGDTVNTAQRVEHHGVAGRVCLSAAAAAVLPARFGATSIGTVDIKGKGRTELFAVDAGTRVSA